MAYLFSLLFSPLYRRPPSIWRTRPIANFTILATIVTAFCTPGAQAEVTTPGANSSEFGSKKAPRDLSEDHWFFLLSAGIGRPNYDSATQTKIDAQKAAGGSSDEAGFADLPGIYRRISPTLAVGAILSMSFENVSGNWHEERSFAIQTYHPSVSALYFPQANQQAGYGYGLGWFGRGDIGSTRIYQRIAAVDSTGARSTVESNEDGYHAQLGFGYGFTASSVARVLVSLNGIYGVAGPYQINGLSFNIGFLL